MILSLGGLLLPFVRAGTAFAAVSDEVSLRVRVNTGAPGPVTDLVGTSTIEGQVDLSWTAPDENEFFPTGFPVASYLVRRATFGVDSLAGDTTAWWNAAENHMTFGPGRTPGTQETIMSGGLDPGTTFFFAVRSLDGLKLLSRIDTKASTPGQQSWAQILDLAPSSPTSVSAVATSSRTIQLAWSAVPADDLDFYRIAVDSTAPYDFADRYLITVDSTSTSFLHTGLAAPATYAYRITAVDKGAPSFAGTALESPVSSVVAAYTILIGKRPMEPMGFKVWRTSQTVSFEWAPTTRFEDGTPFASTSAPTAGELIGYRVMRSSMVCGMSGAYTFFSSSTYNATSAADNAGENAYYYRVIAHNNFGDSQHSAVVSRTGEMHYMLDDCVSEVVLSESQATALGNSFNEYGGSILIARRQRPEDIGGAVMQSVEFKAMLNGVTEIKSFDFPTPARITLHFNVSGGRPVPASLMSPQSGENMAGTLDAQSMKNLGMYWNNGSEYKKLYGKVNAAAQTVTVESPNLGLYQIRSLFRADGVVFDLSNVSNRVITPNGDGLNDQVIFTYDPGPNNAAVAGRVYDVTGALVADMGPGLAPNTLVWDGRAGGRPVSSGVYVYKIEGDGKTFTGTVVVAR